MPVIPRNPKRKREDLEEGELTDEPLTKKTKTKKVFGEYSSLGYKEDSCHSIYLQVPSKLEEVQDVVSKELVSLLNSSGGILCFGARPSGQVYGVRMNRQEEDVLKCTIDEVVKRIHPMVKPSTYRVSFTPVSNRRSDSSYFMYVLEIRVQRGDKFLLYETGGADPKVHFGRKKDSQAFVRDGYKVVGPLTPHKIKERVKELVFEKLKHEADLAQKLHAQTTATSKDAKNKKTPTLCVRSTLDRRTPASVEIVSVVPGKRETNRCPLKVVDKNRVSKRDGSEKASPIVVSSEESDECPLPDDDKAAVGADRNPKAHPKPPPPSSKSVSSHKSNISSLVKSIRRTVKKTFALKKSTQAVGNTATQSVNPKQPFSGGETKSSPEQLTQREVSVPTLKTGPSSKTTTLKSVVVVAHPLMNTVKVDDTRYVPVASSSQIVATKTVTTHSAPAVHSHSTGVSKKSAPTYYTQGQHVANPSQPKSQKTVRPNMFPIRPPPEPPGFLPPAQPTHYSVASYSSSNVYTNPQYNQQHSGRYGGGQDNRYHQDNQHHQYQQVNQHYQYRQVNQHHQYQQVNQHHQYQKGNQRHQYQHSYPYQPNVQY